MDTHLELGICNTRELDLFEYKPMGVFFQVCLSVPPEKARQSTDGHDYFKGFGGMMPLFLFIFEILLCIQYIHYITFIQYIHPSPIAEVPFHVLIAGQLSGRNLRGVPSRDRTRACLAARRRTTN
jgi:hypothetical protein